MSYACILADPPWHFRALYAAVMRAHVRRMDGGGLEYVAVRRPDMPWEERLVAAFKMLKATSPYSGAGYVNPIQAVATDFGITPGDCRSILARRNALRRYAV